MEEFRGLIYNSSQRLSVILIMSFWKPGTIAPGSSIDRDTSGDGSGSGGGGASAITGRVSSNLGISERRNRLPISKQRTCPLLVREAHQSELIAIRERRGLYRR